MDKGIIKTIIIGFFIMVALVVIGFYVFREVKKAAVAQKTQEVVTGMLSEATKMIPRK